MTDISVVYKDDIYILRMDGHAGLDENGKDIACAALSVIEYMLVSWAEANSDAVEILEICENPGYVFLELRIKDDVFAHIAEIVNMGFEGLCTLYPDNIKITCQTGGNKKIHDI